MAVSTGGPISSGPDSAGPVTAPSAPFGVPVAVINQNASWAALVDAVAILQASGNAVYREIEILAGGAAGAFAAVDPTGGVQVTSAQLDELLSLAHQVLSAARVRTSLLARG